MLILLALSAQLLKSLWITFLCSALRYGRFGVVCCSGGIYAGYLLLQWMECSLGGWESSTINQ